MRNGCFMIDIQDEIHVADRFCRDCESTNVRIEHVPSVEPAREGHWPEFSYLRPVVVCNEPDCGEEFLAKEHKEALHNAVRKAAGLLTPPLRK